MTYLLAVPEGDRKVSSAMVDIRGKYRGSVPLHKVAGELIDVLGRDPSKIVCDERLAEKEATTGWVFYPIIDGEVTEQN
jgi:hypothetical protein